MNAARAAAITQESNDKQQLAAMLERVEQNLGAKPAAATADAGYFSEDQVNDERVKGIELYVATGKQKHGQPARFSPMSFRLNQIRQWRR